MRGAGESYTIPEDVAPFDQSGVPLSERDRIFDADDQVDVEARVE